MRKLEIYIDDNLDKLYREFNDKIQCDKKSCHFNRGNKSSRSNKSS